MQREIKNKIKHIPEKKYYPKNLFLYGDARTGKTTIARQLSKALSNGTSICAKAKDTKYFNKYDNQIIILQEEFS